MLNLCVFSVPRHNIISDLSVSDWHFCARKSHDHLPDQIILADLSATKTKPSNSPLKEV